MRNLSEIHRPTTIEEALALLRRATPRTAVLAGGTELVGTADPGVEAVVMLDRLGLDWIELDERRLVIGAMMTLQQLADAPEVRGFAGGAVASAAHDATSSLLRRQATVGGSLVEAAADLATTLLAVGADVAIVGEAASRMPLSALYEGGREALAGRLLTEVVIPRRAGVGVSRHRVGRTPGDAPIVVAAAALTLRDGAVDYVGMAVGGAGRPVRLQSANALAGQELTNRRIDEAAAAASEEMPDFSDFRATAEYRRHAAGVLLRRALGDAWRAALETLEGRPQG